MTTAPSGGSGRPGGGGNFGLDVVRAGAILAVLFSHTAEWFLGAGQETSVQSAYIGYAGVEVFFSLSGFLIGGILLRALAQDPGPRGLARFWARRWLRTLPAYWAMLLFLCWWFGVWRWRDFLFLQNFVPRTDWVLLTPHAWSLVLEEWFYLFFPILAAVLFALLRRWRAGLAVPAACLLLAVACTAGRLLAYEWPALLPIPGVPGPDPSINPLLRLDCAAWGVLAAWAVRACPRLAVPGRAGAVLLVVVGAAALGGLGRLFWLIFYPQPWMAAIPRFQDIWMVGHSTAVELAAVCVILGLHRLMPAGRGAAAACVRFVARTSYALYLVHVPVLYLVPAFGLDPARDWTARAATTALILAVALLVRHGIERPLLALRDGLVPDARTARPAAPGRRGSAPPDRTGGMPAAPNATGAAR